MERTREGPERRHPYSKIPLSERSQKPRMEGWRICVGKKKKQTKKQKRKSKIHSELGDDVTACRAQALARAFPTLEFAISPRIALTTFARNPERGTS